MNQYNFSKLNLRSRKTPQLTTRFVRIKGAAFAPNKGDFYSSCQHLCQKIIISYINTGLTYCFE